MGIRKEMSFMKTSMLIEEVLENRLRSLVGEESIQKVFVKEQCQASK